MRAKDVPVGSRVEYYSNKAWYLGKIGGRGALLGWKPGEITNEGIGWKASNCGKDVEDILTKHGYDRGWRISEDTDLKVLGGPSTMASVSHSQGQHCKLCADFAAYAEPNRADGSFICYVCRQGWIPIRLQ